MATKPYHGFFSKKKQGFFCYTHFQVNPYDRNLKTSLPSNIIRIMLLFYHDLHLIPLSLNPEVRNE